jgi:hypothetical protein
MLKLVMAIGWGQSPIVSHEGIESWRIEKKNGLGKALEEVRLDVADLVVGERLTEKFPHSDHKGNMRVTMVESGAVIGIAECVMKGCEVRVRVVAVGGGDPRE